jgi:hypothetical protein
MRLRSFSVGKRAHRSTPLSPDSAVRTGSREQGTNLPQRRQCVLPLRRRRLSVRCVTTVSKWSCEPEPKKTLKLTVECLHCSWFAPSSLFNCRIRAECGNLQPQFAFVLGQPGGEFGYAFLEVDLGFPAEISVGERNIEGAAHAVRGDFGGVGMLADLEL